MTDTTLLGATAAPRTDPWSARTTPGYDYYDTPSGSIWRPGAEPGRPPAANPGVLVAESAS